MNSYKVDEWEYCNAAFDYFALIRTSSPLNDESIELPRFVVAPQYSYEHLGSNLRGAIGQPYGRTIGSLRTLTVNFVRVKAYQIDEYYKKVGLTIPHFIVPYPENVFNVPPFWGTLEEPPKFTKRDENGWYWNLSLSFKEAY